MLLLRADFSGFFLFLAVPILLDLLLGGRDVYRSKVIVDANFLYGLIRFTFRFAKLSGRERFRCFSVRPVGTFVEVLHFKQGLVVF